MLTWNKEAAIAKMQADTVLAEVIQIEPRLRPIINLAIAQEPYEGYNRVRVYTRLKRQACNLVGYDAENPKLCTSAYYDAVIEALYQLLPPDEIDRIDAGEEEGEPDE